MLTRATVLAVSLFVIGGLPAMAEEKGKPSYLYKTIGERTLRVDVLYPEDWEPEGKLPGMVFFSGGAFRTGTTRQFQPQAGYFAKRGLVTVRAEYRDSTRDKVKLDTCLMDAISALRWVRRNAALLGVDPDRIIGAGGSAGGYLAAATATVEGFHDEGDDLEVSPKPNALVLFNPVVDCVEIEKSRHFLGDEALAERLSPIHHVTKDLPPTLILIGSEDGFYGQNDEFLKKARALGVQVEREVYDGQPHAFFNRSPWMEKTVLRADEFLTKLGYLKDEPEVDPPSAKPKRP